METQKPGAFTGKAGAITNSEKEKKIIEFTHKVSIPEIKETWWGVEEVKISTILFEPESFDTGFDTSTVSVKTGLSWS